jgi:hypothetical protein
VLKSKRKRFNFFNNFQGGSDSLVAKLPEAQGYEGFFVGKVKAITFGG